MYYKKKVPHFNCVVCLKSTSKFILFLVTISIVFTRCKKFVQVAPPVTSIANEVVFSNNTSASAVMTGVYDQMENANSGISDGASSLSLYGGLLADELTNYSTAQNVAQVYKNALASSTNGASNYYYWTELYSEIYSTNSVIEGLQKSTNITTAIKQQLTGEAKFMRAFLHFYAVNLY